MGEKRRASVKKEIPEKSAVVVKTLRIPETSAPPNVGSKKYFCFSSQVITSFACGVVSQGVGCGAMSPCQGAPACGTAAPTAREGMVGSSQSFDEGCIFFAYRRFTTEYSISFVSVRMS